MSELDADYDTLEGRITNMPAFLALMNHIHSVLSPTLHTPILLIAQPAWTAQDIEALTQFFFEKFKTPAFCIMDSALAISYAYGIQNGTVIDVGFQKTDITTIHDFSVQHVGRAISVAGTGGDAMTERLLELLGPKGWTKDMCEQLKKSPFCEILPAGAPLPGAEGADDQAAGGNGAAGGEAVAHAADAPRAHDADVDEDDAEKGIDDEGVLDVASIVASGKTQEFLAQQERKKQLAASRKAAKDARDAAEVAGAKPIRLPNSKREKVIFHYQERKAQGEIDEALENGNKAAAADVEMTEPVKEKTPEAAAAEPATKEAEAPVAETTGETKAAPAPEASGEAKPAEAAPAPAADAEAKPAEAAPAAEADSEAKPAEAAPAAEANGEAKPAEAAPTAPDASVTVEDASAKREQVRAAKREEKRKAREGAGDPMQWRREIEVGTERFQAASNGLLDRIADAVHRTVLAGTESSKRGDLWDSLIIVGNGSRVRGFKDALLATLMKKYLISPSSASIFTSELPSNLSTPMGTGAQTPQRDYPAGQHALPTGSGVNPLLLAATTASNPTLNPNISVANSFGGSGSHSHSSHGQTPTSMKIAKVPEYFPEFKVCLPFLFSISEECNKLTEKLE
jgi:actin-related protein 9